MADFSATATQLFEYFNSLSATDFNLAGKLVSDRQLAQVQRLESESRVKKSPLPLCLVFTKYKVLCMQ